MREKKGSIDCDRAKAKIESKRSMIVPNPICHSHTGTPNPPGDTHPHPHTITLSGLMVWAVLTIP
ncbi:hypothetical protein BDV24DRAFT_145974 [Aspergillus arachidicola]|uniref:Uncharacterized protein n=1 Tax=Aspergillus arachidicola TaxID=656916 RepID=A0A5N6XN57_9EURO|nr:hypothetical protein BDV24DRAFT_145974 [Aspergillus arachidicola]